MYYVRYLELEDVEYDFDADGDSRLRHIRFAQMELACDREAMLCYYALHKC